MKKTGLQISNTDSDLVVTNGELTIGDTLYQNQYIILQAQKGDLKEYPLMGVGIEDITNDDDLAEWKRRIRDEMKKDGLTVTKTEINTQTGEILIRADYE